MPARILPVRRLRRALPAPAVAALLLACGGSGSTPSHAVSVTVSGLAGAGLVLQNGGGDDLPIAADGTYTFATQVPEGATYRVTVRSQPATPATRAPSRWIQALERCAVAGGEGTMGGADVSGIAVTCETASCYRGDDGAHG